jgi:hypothetical protein
LFISIVVVLVSVWFVLAPRLHKWPFEEPPPVDDAAKTEPWLTDLTETDDPDAAPLATFHVESPHGEAAQAPESTPPA